MTELSPLRDTMRFDGSNVTAVLGPTNTGKTFLAIERMVAHSSGTIGLPLRLLAREVYQKVCDRVGPAAVSLITGEEKIKPPNARYQVCTVEAMPREPGTAFVAIDEVQLSADLERGHVFTDRILHTRGREETLLLGSATMQGVLQRLLKGTQTTTRPRLSNLLYAGSKKLTRLPRRSAIVAFSADEVYAIAELIRRQRGGAAVVLGALSPRTRNAQVELYQAGEVDFLVATDAIGMGLNLDVDHVAFAQDWKFDGFQYRQLTAAEFGQIAGRAGRHVRDGTFGVTGHVDPLPDELVEALESHHFQPVRVLQWRSRDFDFSSVEALRTSLEEAPPSEYLTRSLPAVDQRALEMLSRDPNVLQRAQGRKRVELLWEACKLPDYRRIAPAQHAEIIATIYADLAETGHVAEDYMASQVRRADRTDGDLDTLSQRIAEIRTWTYISHRPEWLTDPTHWQEKTRAIEDRLSDALHDRLTKRFVDRRTSVLMRRLRENAVMEAEIGGDGRVSVEGHAVGELHGFRFTPDVKADGPDAKAVRAAAQKALAGEFEKRAERFSNAPNGDLALGSDGLIRWLGAPVATLTTGEHPLKPKVVLLADEQLTGPARDMVAARAERFVTYQVSTLLKPLVDLDEAQGLEGAARGLAFRLVEAFGLVERREVADDVRSLDQNARATLRRLGVRFGAYHIFVPALVKPAPASLLTLLWAVKNDGRDRPGYGEVVQLLSTGRTSAVADPSFDPVFWSLSGYRRLGRRAVRVDILERLADLIRPALAWKPGTGKRPEGGYDGAQFLVTPAMMSILGATADDMDEVLKGLGYRSESVEAGEVETKLDRLDDEASPVDANVAATTEAAAGAAEADAVLSAEEAGPWAAAGRGAPKPAAPERNDLGTLSADASNPAAEAAATSFVDNEREVDVSVLPIPGAAAKADGEAEDRPTEADAVARPDEEAQESETLEAPGEQATSGFGVAGNADVASPPASAAAAADTKSDVAPPKDQTRRHSEIVVGARPAPSASRSKAEGDGEGETAAEGAEGPKFVQVWRLQRNGQRTAGRRGEQARGRGGRQGGQDRRPGSEGQSQSRGGEKPQGKKRNEGPRQKEGGRPDKRFGDRPQGRPDRTPQADPDSPFAKLAALKDKLGK